MRDEGREVGKRNVQPRRAGRQMVRIDSFGRRPNYGYNRVGKPMLKHHASGNRVTMSYDATGQLCGWRYPGQEAVLGVRVSR